MVLLLHGWLPVQNAWAENPPVLEPVIVTADPLNSALNTLPSSATVITSDSYNGKGSESLEESLSLVPNVNFAGGTNAPRFFQIRGIGELEQYEGAPASSVGLLVDDFDFTGLGSVVQTFDAEQIEVLRGPQGMAFGQNALAGLMHIKLADPTDEPSGKGRVVLGSDDLMGGGLAVGGPIDGTDKSVQFHVSLYRDRQNGFRHDIFLGRDDTNKRDQFTGIAKLRILPTSKTTVDLSFLRADMRNGYDVFAIDNTFATQSDRPGKDAQGTSAGTLKLSTEIDPDVKFTTISSLTNSIINYSFDGDWGNDPFWSPNLPFDFFSRTFRKREQAYQEFRLASPESDYSIGRSYRWLAGAYGQRLTEESSIQNDSDGVPYDILDSNFHAWTTAAFGQVEVPLFEHTSGTVGLRVEQKNAQYEDSRLTNEDPNDTMLGGNFSLQHQLTDSAMVYGLVSRGYKAGGVNTGIGVPSERRTFEPEFLWNFETGIKGDFKDLKLATNVALFYQKRREQQLKLALQNDPDDPLAFTYLTDNAADGDSYGLELDASVKATQQLSFDGSVSLLNIEVNNRAASHAPRWQYAVGPKYRLTDNMYVKAQAYGKDGYYYDDSFDIKSSEYSLLDLTVGYETADWSWTVWGKNVLDRKYSVRGFYFGLEPPNFENKLYKQMGDPFQFGTTLTFYF